MFISFMTYRASKYFIRAGIGRNLIIFMGSLWNSRDESDKLHTSIAKRPPSTGA
jgi:hypothetical protein